MNAENQFRLGYIDDSEFAYLKVLCDELFGRDNFIATNVWQKRYSRENRESIGDVHEYIVVYAKNPFLFKLIRNKVEMTDDMKKVYKNPNNDPKGPWRAIPITAQAGHATKSQFYTITGPTGIEFQPPKGNCWRFTKKAFDMLNTQGRIYFGKNGDSQPTTIRYLTEVEGVIPWTWWPNTEVGHTDMAKKEQNILYGGDKAFETPKPELLIERILHIASNENDLILDAFLGSGTTIAVANKMNRRWIGIEIGNQIDTHIMPRLLGVLSGKDRIGISEKVHWKGGGSFKYYHLGPSIIHIDKHGKGDFNWELGPRFIEESLLASYDYIQDQTVKLPALELFKTDNTPVLGYLKQGSRILAAACTLNQPGGLFEMMSFEEVQSLYQTMKKHFNPGFITIFTNRGVEIALDSKPDDLEIIKVPHAIFAALES